MTEARIIPLRDANAQRSLAERTDEELMLLVRAGERSAMDVLVGRYHARLVSFCAKRTGDRVAAEELVQDCFLRLWQGRERYRSEGKLVVLLYTAARNLCANHARSWRRRLRWFAPDAPAGGAERVRSLADDQIDVLVERERRVEVERAIGELPDKMREAIALRFEHGLGYDEIAAIVGSNAATMRSRVHLGLEQVRATIARGAS